MWSPRSRSREETGARREAARKVLACVLAALFGLALAWPAGAPAQTASRDAEGIQRRLTELGYDAGAADGLFGPKTRAALRAFQADQGLPATGLPDANTRRVLFAAEPSGAFADSPAPSLAAVPLEPVQVAPLAPLARASPHDGLTADYARAVRSSETGPPIRTDRGEPPAPLETAAKRESRNGWGTWAAATLAAFGALAIVAAAGLRSARRASAGDEPPRRPLPFADPAAATTVRRGRVYGVDVPPSGHRRAG